MKTTFALTLSLTIIAPAFADSTAMPGQLCIGNTPDAFRSQQAECRPASPPKIAVSVPAQRLFIFWRADTKTALFGRVDASTRSLDLSSPAGMRVIFQIHSASRNWPQPTELKLKDGTRQSLTWQWTMPKEVVASLREISLPPGTYVATISAPHHEPLSLKIDPRPKTDFGKVELQPLPMLVGKVIDRAKRVPIFGALITDDSAKTLALTDGAGDFRHELLADDNPTSISVSSPGYGTRKILLPRSRATRLLPPIELDLAGSLHVRVDRDPKKYHVLKIDLAQMEGRKEIDVKHGQLSAGEEEWVANNLDRGEYVVIVAGEKPLQRLGRRVTVKTGEVSNVEIKIEPIDLTGTVSRGSARIANAEVTMKSSRNGWSSVVTAAEDGTFEQELWQGGRFTALVTAADLREPYIFSDEIGESSVAHWNIVIPEGKISGRVIDAQSGDPIVGATVTLDSTLPDNSNRSVGGSSDRAGRFIFEGVAQGAHAIYAEAQKYITSTPRALASARDNQATEVEIALRRSGQYHLLVTRSDGAPLVGAFVIYAGLPEGEPPVTDMGGGVVVDIDPNQGALLAILPKSGSFALFRVPPRSEIPDKPVPVTVTAPAASLKVRTEDQGSGLPIKNVHLLLRYNGELLDPPLLRLISRIRGVSFTTDQHGELLLPELPAGMYELWPYGWSEEVTDMIQRQTPPSAAVPVIAGAYEVTLKFSTTKR